MVSTAQREAVTRLLGREPRGLEAIPVFSPSGDPAVIRVASLVDDKPFPTLYWLVDRDLNYRIDTEEAGGLIAVLQSRIDSEQKLQQSMQHDHRRHIAHRQRFLNEEQRARIERLGFSDVLAQRGIGGIADFTRIRCLHTWYAAHLVEANTVGRLLDEYWVAREGGATPQT